MLRKENADMATQNTAMDNAALIKEVNEAHKHKK